MPTFLTRGLKAVALFPFLAFGATPAEDFFEAKVRPVLIRSCYGCHGQGRAGGLGLESREGMLKGGTRGPAMVPGQPEASRLVTAIHYQTPGLQMPPPGRLPPAEIKAIEQWIRDGAPWPAAATSGRDKNFWSYRKPVLPAAPPVKNTAWPAGAIDKFTLAKMEEHGLAPAADADRLTLIRRVTFGLIGLPPTPEQVQQFAKDPSPQAYENLIDRLLATKAYAERWGRLWLDVVRYADTSGSGADYPIPDAHKYRDWVIQALAEDKPYDQFIREQIAGDLLPSSSEADHWNKTIATGYLAIARRGEGPSGVIADAVDNIGYAFLGTSLACARCHDHKFDPIPTRDYYAIYGILSSTRFPQPASEPIRYEQDFVYRDPQALKSQEYLVFEAQLEPIAKSIAAVNRLPYFDDVLPLLQARRMDLYKKEPQFERAYAVAEGEPANAKVQIYGDPKALGSEAPRGFLQVLGGQQLPPETKGSGRLELANWIAAAGNPLTARVMVNRLWQGHFGKGLVTTANDFGSRGVPPAHPELLDYLASRFVAGGWSMKRLHKEILLSRTYRLSTALASTALASTALAADNDPDNIYLSRHNRRRFDAEQLRDTILAVTGTLDPSPAGAHPFPPAHEWNYSGHVPFEGVYATNHRSVYLMSQRIRQHPYLGLFDGPDTSASTAQRTSNATSPQALFFLNGELPAKAAEALASTLVKEYPTSAAQTDRIFALLLGRSANAAEKERARTFLASAAAVYAKRGALPAEAQRKAVAAFIEAMLATNEFLYLE